MHVTLAHRMGYLSERLNVLETAEFGSAHPKTITFYVTSPSLAIRR